MRNRRRMVEDEKEQEGKVQDGKVQDGKVQDGKVQDGKGLGAKTVRNQENIKIIIIKQIKNQWAKEKISLME
jgi:hypothetical protein